MDNKPDKLSFPDLLRIEGIGCKGYGIIPKYVMLDTDLSIEAKSIYAYLCSYSGSGTTAFPGREKILYDLQIGKQAFYTHFKQLTDQGYILVTRRKDESKKFKNNVYTLVENPKKFLLPASTQEKNSLYSRIYFSGIKSLGYGMIPKAVMVDQRLPIKSKGIYAYFASFTGAGNHAFPKKETILYHLAISENTYYKFYKILTQLNYISSVQRHIKGKLSIKDYYLNAKPDEANISDKVIVAVFKQDNDVQHRKYQHMENADMSIQHRNFQDMENADTGVQHRNFQDMENADMDIQHRKNPDMEESRINANNQGSSNAGVQHRNFQDMENADTGVQHRKYQHMEDEYMGNQDMENQHMTNQHMTNQHMINQYTENPDTNINNPNINNTYYKQSVKSINQSNTKQNREIDRWNNTENNNMSEVKNDVIRSMVYHTLDTQKRIPYEYNRDPRAMTHAIHYLTSWDIYSGTGMGSEYNQAIYNLFNAALIDMCCKQDKMYVRNAYVTYAMVIDRINEIGNDTSDSNAPFSLCSLMLDVMSDYTKGVEKSAIIQNPIAYMQSCIWTRMQTGNVDVYSFMRRDGLI